MKDSAILFNNEAIDLTILVSMMNYLGLKSEAYFLKLNHLD